MGRTPWEVVTGSTPNILEWIEFDWYQPVWYHDPGDFLNNNLEHVGRWLGVSHRVGQALCYWILPSSGRPIARTTVRPWTNNDRCDPNSMTRLETSIKLYAFELMEPTLSTRQACLAQQIEFGTSLATTKKIGIGSSRWNLMQFKTRLMTTLPRPMTLCLAPQ